jgi:cell division GTPase FtsZ
MKDNQTRAGKEKLNAYDIAFEAWKINRLLDINSIPFDEVCADLTITNSINNKAKANEPIPATIFNNQESINIGLFVIPNQFDKANTQEHFMVDFQSVRGQFDALLLMSEDSNFIDFGFKKILSNDKNNTIIHYRNSCFDFESFKDVFKPKSIVIMKTAFASGSNRAMEAIISAFKFPDFYSNQIVEIKNTIVCVAYGKDKYTNDEVNSICIYSLDQIKRGASLTHDTFEDMSLGNDIRVSVFISGFNTTE